MCIRDRVYTVRYEQSVTLEWEPLLNKLMNFKQAPREFLYTMEKNASSTCVLFFISGYQRKTNFDCKKPEVYVIWYYEFLL